MNIEKIRQIAKNNSWREIDHQENIYMISFHKVLDESTVLEKFFRKYKEGTQCRINIYYTKMTVATALTHPKKGRTQLFRKNVTDDVLNKIFQDPRTHTRSGYYTK